MIGILLAEATTQEPSLLGDLGPLAVIVSMLIAGWQTIKASKKAALLRAAIVGIKAGLDSLAAGDAEAVKGAIESAAGGKSALLNQELKAEVRKTTSAMVAVDADGNPFPKRAGAIMLALLLPLALASGCVSAAIHTVAVEAKSAGERLHDSSQPSETWLAKWDGKPDTRPGHEGETWSRASLAAVWSSLWGSLEGSHNAIVEATR